MMGLTTITFIRNVTKCLDKTMTKITYELMKLTAVYSLKTYQTIAPGGRI